MNQEISIAKLNKTYGRHCLRVLEPSHLTQLKVARGSPRRYVVKDGLPTKEQFDELFKKKFTVALADAVSDAFREWESLLDELNDWYYNLPESFQNGDKGDQLRDAISQLEQCSEPDVPEFAQQMGVFVAPAVNVSSRADRCGQSCYSARQAAEACERAADEKKFKAVDGTDVALTDEQVDELDDLKNELNNAADEADGVEFPGMY